MAQVQQKPTKGGLPLYEDAREDAPKLLAGTNLGLWYERFFNQYDANWKVIEGSKSEEQGKQKWIETVTGKRGDEILITRQRERMTRLVKNLGGEVKVYATDWHFVTGLGLNHPVENGFSWHPTLGVPYLPGSAVKGLLKAWMDQWSELGEKPEWFGTPDKVGDLIFFDALPVASIELALDVMTPHMDKWYEKGGETPLAPDCVPADWHNPIPVPFLAVKKGSFLFALASRSRAESHVTEAFAELTKALEILGAGAKTAAGYGRFGVDEKWQRQLEEEKVKQAEEAQKRQAEDAERERLAALPPLERELEELAQANPTEAKYLVILKALEAGHWQEPESKQVADYVKQWMVQQKLWREKSEKKNQAGDKPHQRTLRVMKFL